MRKKMLITMFIIAGIVETGLFRSVRAETKFATEMVTASKDTLLAKHEKSNRVFKRLEIEEVKIVSYFHRRKIGEAIVEKDFIRYQFNTETGELIEETKRWREDLPDSVTPVITQEEAESKVEGTITSRNLFFISPESDVFPIKPTPKNPCWILWSRDGKRRIITIIDAMTGEKLGYGVPPPYEGFSCYGPDWGDCPQDPIEYWNNHADNARAWFETMGYSTEKVGNASAAKIQSHIQSDSTAMFFELNHGGSWSFHNYCDSDIDAGEVETWIASYANMPFTFLGSCGGMCDQSDNHLSYEFRKGSNIDTVTVGYCGMGDPPCEDDCWPDAVNWQDTLFDWMADGYTVYYAFYRANLAFPDCADNSCMRFAGDTNLRVVPVVTRSLCGAVYNGHKGPLTLNSRDYYIRCGITVPSGQTLTIDPSVDLVFLNDSKATSNGTLNANGAAGQIRFVSEQDRNKGMEFTGQLRLQNGGQIKIYE